MKVTVSFIFSCLICFVIIWFTSENHEMELRLLKQKLEQQNLINKKDEERKALELKNLELELIALKASSLKKAQKVEEVQSAVESKIQHKVSVGSNTILVSKIEEPVIKEAAPLAVDKSLELSRQLKISQERVKQLERLNSEQSHKLSLSLRKDSSEIDPLLQVLPTRTTIHDLTEQGIIPWLELGEFLKLPLEDKDALGRTPVHLAAELGRTDALDTLYKFGNAIDVEDDLGKTPLHLAVEAKSDAFMWLVKKGLDVDIKDHRGWKLIHYAAKVGNLNAMAFIKAKGLDIHEEAPKAITPLMIALAYQQVELASWLLTQGARVDIRDQLGQTALHYAARFCEPSAISMIAKHFPGINTPDVHGRTALHYAAILGREKMVDTLLNVGAIAVVKDNGHCSPIHHATLGGHQEVVELFLNYGVHVDELDVVGRTPLHLAVVLGHVQMVDLLIKWGANVSMLDGLGRSPIDWANHLKRHSIIERFENL